MCNDIIYGYYIDLVNCIPLGVFVSLWLVPSSTPGGQDG